MTAIGASQNSERRSHKRARSLKNVKLIMNDQHRLYDGMLINVTAYGAAVSVSIPDHLPDSFKLQFVQDDLTVPCRVRWRHLNKLGVSF